MMRSCILLLLSSIIIIGASIEYGVTSSSHFHQFEHDHSKDSGEYKTFSNHNHDDVSPEVHGPEHEDNNHNNGCEGNCRNLCSGIHYALVKENHLTTIRSSYVLSEILLRDFPNKYADPYLKSLSDPPIYI